MRPTIDAIAKLAADHEIHNRLRPAHTYANVALSRAPTHPLARLVAARCARRSGELSQALSHLKAVPIPAQVSDHIHECARVLDRQGHTEQALAAFTKACELRRQEHPPVNRTVLPRFIDAVENCFTADWVQSWTPLPISERAAPLFMVGFNRSGTTLLGESSRCFREDIGHF